MRFQIIILLIGGILFSCENDSPNSVSETPSKEEQTDSISVASASFLSNLVDQSEGLIRVAGNNSYRGMHVLSEDVIWLSGSNSTVTLSLNGGENWKAFTIEDCPNCDFRDITALNDSTAIVISIGSPGKIYKTSNWGSNWKKVYHNDDSLIFMDAIEFWDDDRGLVFGDPVDGLVFLLETSDGGESWSRIASKITPSADGTAGFAASGTSIALGEGGRAWIGTGGKHAWVLHSNDYGVSWGTVESQVPDNNPGNGVYSLAMSSSGVGMAVGGNWEYIESDSVLSITNDYGESWELYEGVIPNGYRSCVAYSEYKNTQLWVCTGSSGTDISYDNGQSWKTIDSTGYNIVEFAPHSNIAWLADGKGHITKLKLADK